MTTLARILSIALLLLFTMAGAAWAQVIRGDATPAQCRNNLKQLGIAMHDQPPGGRALAGGRHRVELCEAADGSVTVNVVDGTSNTVLVSEAAQLRGCPADLEDFGAATVRMTDRPDGRSLLTLVSQEHRGCTATALLLPAIQRAREAPERPAANGGGDAGARFWVGLSRAEAAALSRRLEGLAARARRGANVEREMNAVRAQYPAAPIVEPQVLEGRRLGFVSPGGGEEPAVCIGYAFYDENGKLRCIGVLVD
jgi:hypothetical protein